jgi:hypothetical protein
MSDENLEHRINFHMKITKSASETLVLLTVVYDEYTMKKLSVSELQRWFKEGREMCKMTHEAGNQKHKVQMQMWARYETWCAPSYLPHEASIQ